MPKYRKKPVVVEAMKFEGDPSACYDVLKWVEENTLGSFDYNDPDVRENPPASGVSIDAADGAMVIATLEGWMKVSMGDYVICGVQGEFYPCKPDIFEASYEKVEEA
jgi:hypothetical protein